MPKIFTKYSTIWFFLAVILFIIIFQNSFFSINQNEKVHLYSHYKNGSRAFYDLSSELGIKISPVYDPIYIWMKPYTTKTLSETENIKKKKMYMIDDKGKGFTWNNSEANHLIQWLEQGHDIAIISNKPSVYLEALFMPGFEITSEDKRLAKNNFAHGLTLSTREILHDFAYQNLNRSLTPVFNNSSISLADKKNEVSSYYCRGNLNESTGERGYRLAGKSGGLKDYSWQLLEKSGAKKLSYCKNAHDFFAVTYLFKSGKIKFISVDNILDNQVISIGQNIELIFDLLQPDQYNQIYWDEFHLGNFKRPNLAYYLTQTIAGRSLIFIIASIIIAALISSRKLKKYPLKDNHAAEITGNSLIHYHALVRKMSPGAVKTDIWNTFLKLKEKEIYHENHSGKVYTEEVDENNKLKIVRDYFTKK